MTTSIDDQHETERADDGFAARILRFHRTHGRWPSATAASQHDERSLAEALQILVGDAHHTTWRPRLQRLADVPTHLAPATVTEALRDFIASHGRRPRSDSHDAEERGLADRVERSIRRQPAGRGVLPERQYISGRGRRFDLARFQDRVDELLASRDAAGRWPRKGAPTLEERGLWEFRQKLRSPLRQSAIDYLWSRDQKLARWATDPRSVKHANRAVAIIEIGEHIQRFGTEPRHTDPDRHVRSLARALSDLRKEGVAEEDRALATAWLSDLALPI